MAISLRLNTRWQTTIATVTRLPCCAPRNDKLKHLFTSEGTKAVCSYSRPVWFDKVGTREFQGLFKVVEIKHPLVLSLSKDG